MNEYEVILSDLSLLTVFADNRSHVYMQLMELHPDINVFDVTVRLVRHGASNSC